MKHIKILIPIDESDFSRQALSGVTQTLNPQQTEITLLRVSSQPQMPEGQPMPPAIHGAILSSNNVRVRPESSHAPIYIDELRASISSNFKQQLAKDKAALEAQGFKVNTLVRFGDAALEIVAEAQKGYDLISMTTHGRSGLSRVLMGSVAEKVMRNVNIPVMMFKPQKRATPKAA